MPNTNKERLLILYIPWLLSLILQVDPISSYLTAWAGSFYIFYITLNGRIRPLPDDLPVASQIMRPIFLTQIIFAGYMASTSIFYFIGELGYVNFESPKAFFALDWERIEDIAQCQRYYVLAHASYVTGLFLVMDYSKEQKFDCKIKDFATFFMAVALITLPLSTSFLIIPSLRQFYFQFNSLSFIAGTLALAYAIPQKKIGNTVVCGMLYFSNFTQSLLSGYKEPIIISVLVLGIFLYPHYKRTILIIFIPILLMLFIVLPTYNQVFRQQAWSGNESAQDASNAAIDAVLNSDIEDTSQWAFLTSRLSEISMFVKYINTTPSINDYYGFTLFKQALIVIIPRAFWANKPSTEQLVMERVYDAGVVERGTIASAKPPLVVDGYLSGGTFGVFITLLIYGLITQSISMKAEELFGGYTLGTALIFSGLFQILWRGLSFEFLSNSVFWSFVTMYLINRIMVALGYLHRK